MRTFWHERRLEGGAHSAGCPPQWGQPPLMIESRAAAGCIRGFAVLAFALGRLLLLLLLRPPRERHIAGEVSVLLLRQAAQSSHVHGQTQIRTERNAALAVAGALHGG